MKKVSAVITELIGTMPQVEVFTKAEDADKYFMKFLNDNSYKDEHLDGIEYSDEYMTAIIKDVYLR